MRRMAQAVGSTPLPPEVVLCVCSTLVRLSQWSTPMVSRSPKTTWRLSWQQSTIPVLHAAGGTPPVMVLVTDEPAGKVLAFRCLQSPPTSAELGLTLYDALVDPQLGQLSLHPQIHPPARLVIRGSLPAEMTQVAQEWGMEIVEGEPAGSPFLRQWEAELTGRMLDPIHYLRVFDRACERMFGYAPFLQKQRRARWMGWHSRLEYDPANRRPGSYAQGYDHGIQAQCQSSFMVGKGTRYHRHVDRKDERAPQTLEKASKNEQQQRRGET